MSISKVDLKRFAKLISEEFLRGKPSATLQTVTQDEIDAFIIPIMTEVEDLSNEIIADKIRDAFDTEPLNEEDDFWPMPGER